MLKVKNYGISIEKFKIFNTKTFNFIESFKKFGTKSHLIYQKFQNFR